MALSLLTPAAALVGLLVALPLAALVAGERRTARVADALGLPPHRPLRGAIVAVAVVLAAVLVSAAAAQPVLERRAVERTRPSAEVMVVLDTTRSMLARPGPNGVARFDRAVPLVLALREQLHGIPVGVSSMTDRVLPHLFPTDDVRAYRSTLERAIAIDRPPPSVRKVVATSLDALDVLATRNLFDRRTAVRVAVVVSDFETAPYRPAELAEVLAKERVQLVLVHVGNPRERIYETPEDARYGPDPRARETVRQLAAVTGGASFGEDEVGRAAAAVRDAVDDAPRVEAPPEPESVELARWLALAALLPVAFVVRTRNRA